MGALMVRDLAVTGRGAGGRETILLDDVSFILQPGRAIVFLGPDDGGGPVVVDVLAGRRAARSGTVELLRRPDDPEPPLGDRESRRQEIVDALALAPLLGLGVPKLLREISTYSATRRRRVVVPSAEEVYAKADARPGAERDGTAFDKLRLSIAVAAALAPKVILAHVPWRGFGVPERRRAAALFDRLKRDGVACLVATQDEMLAAAIADVAVLMFDGVPTAEGPPEETLPACVAALREEAP